MPARPASGSFTNGATITASSGTYIGDGAGEWYFGPDVITGSTGVGNALYLYTNAPVWNGGAGVQAQVVNGQVYLQNSAGTWWTWNGNTWTTVAAPPATVATNTNAAAAATAAPQAPAQPSSIQTADGSQVTAPGTALETAAGTLVYLGPQATGDPGNQYGYPIWEAGQHSGYAAGLLLLNGGQIYAVNTPGDWYQWQNGGWTPLAAAPTVTKPATTSTVASPQASTTCTPATTAGGTTATTGSVVGTTTSGDAITDSDIQSLIDQMSSSNATAQQTYTAVLSALQASGASITTGLQQQVATQVTASQPASGTATTSDTGMYIVGGGLALVALLWFMGRRAR